MQLHSARKYLRWASAELAGVNRTDLKRFAFAVSFPVIAGVIAQALSVWFAVSQLSFVFMTSVLLAGAYLGAKPAIAAALVAFGIYNFFLVEPRFSLQLASADDFVTLVLFLAAAVVTGGLAGRRRDQVRISAQRLRTTRALFEASRRLAQAFEPTDIHRALAESANIALTAHVAVLTLAPSRVWRVAASSPNMASLSALELDILTNLSETDIAAPEALIEVEGWVIVLMQGKRGTFGALAAHAHTAGSMTSNSWQTLESLAGLGAVALERSALITEMAEAQALAESDRLRAALLSSLSHDFRTPLATILASATSLLDYSNQLDRTATIDLLRSIREETE